MDRTRRNLLWLALASALACVQNEQEPSPGPELPDDEMPAPCDGYALGESPEDDGACFSWVAVLCAAETSREPCEAAVEIASPKGDLACAWSSETLLLESGPDCVVVDRAPQCIAVAGAGADAVNEQCEGTARWTHFDEETAQELLVELDCAFQPVPDFDPCLDETAAAEACVCT